MTQLAQILSPKNYSLKDHSEWPSYFFNRSNDSGIQVNEKRALMHTGVFRAISLLGGAIATQPKHLLKRGKQREVADEHPAHWLIYRKPNQAQNTFQFHFMAVVHLLLWGNFYAYINRNRWYEPVSIVPIMPWMCEPFIKGGRKYFRVAGKTYTGNEILHVYGLSFDGVKGIKPITYMAESIGIGLAAQKLEATSFGNGMHAGGMIELPEEFAGIMGSTDEEAQEFMNKTRDSFKKVYQDGPGSWHNILFMEPGWKYTQFQMAFEIEKLVANKKFTMADVARMFGVPLHKLMDLERSTNNNIEQQAIEYVQDGVLPIAKNLEVEYDNKLLKESEKTQYYTKINLDGLMRGDIKSRYEAYSIALGRNAPAWMEPSEVRDLEDLDAGNPQNWAIPQNMDTKGERDAA